MTLSDTQLLILSAASQRNDHAAILPASLKGSAAKKVIDRLLKQKLLQELRAKDDMPVWHIAAGRNAPICKYQTCHRETLPSQCDACGPVSWLSRRDTRH